MQSGKLNRLYHPMQTPEIQCRAGPLYLFGRTAPRRGMEEVIVCHSDFVSRRHCHIFFQNDAFWIKDLQSLNGTFLNEVRLLPNVERELRFGDKVGLGVSNNTTDLEPQDPSFYIFIFKQHEVEVIDLDDDDGQEEPIRQRSSSVEIVNEPPPAQPQSKKPLPPPPPPPRLRPEVEPESAPPVIPPAVPSSSNSKAPVKNSVDPLGRIVPEEETPPAKSNPVKSPEPRATPASQKELILTSDSLPSHTLPSSSSVSISAKKPVSQKQISDSNRKPGPASFHQRRGKEHNSEENVPATNKSDSVQGNISKPLLPTKLPNSKDQEKTKHDQITITTSTSAYPNLSLERNAKNQIILSPPSVPPQGQKRKSPADEFANVKSKKIFHSPPTTDSATPELPKGESKRGIPSPCPSTSGTVQIRQNSPTTAPGSARGSTPSNQRMSLDSSSGDDSSDGLQSSEPAKAVSTNGRKSSGTRQVSSEEISNSDSSEDYFVEVPVGKIKKGGTNNTVAGRVPDTNHSNQHKKSTGGSGRVSDKSKSSSVQKVTIKDATTTESGSDNDAPEPKRTKVSKKDEKREETNKLQPNESRGSPELFSYSQPYESPDHALSPISSDEMDSNLGRPRQNSCSDISEDGDDGALHTVSSPTSSPTYNPPSSSPASISTADIKKPQAGRQTKMIDDAPVPRQFRKKNDALERANQNQSKKTVSPKQNQSLKERLKNIAETAADARARAALDVPKPLSRAPVNIKTTGRNRGDELLATMMASANVSHKHDELAADHDHQNVSNTSTNNNSGSSKTTAPFGKPVIPAPRREIPMPSPGTQAQMPLNVIRSHMTTAQQSTSTGVMLPPKPKVPLPEQPVNRMEKHGVTLARQQSKKKEVFEYGHKSTIPRQDPSNTRETNQILLDDDAGYKAVLKWRPAWLEEQKKVKNQPPPVTLEWEIRRTLLHYEDYKSYVLTFFPLLLLETWASVTQDYSTKRRIERDTSTAPELKVAITNCQTTAVCPMTDSRWRDRVARSRDRYYTVVDCYAILNNQHEINHRCDFAICSFGIKCQDPTTKEIVKKKREFFGYVLTSSSHNKTPINDNSIIHPTLKGKNPQAKFIFSFQVVIHSGNELDLSQLGTIQKIAYISPKLRDVKALVYLKHSKLHNAIIQTQPAKSSWNPHAVISQHHLVQHVTKLNPVQKSAVAYVVERVKSNDEELVLVHGPPGTGKTRTVVGMILQLLASSKDIKSDRRVLVCTPSNTALDEIMLRLEEAIKALPSTSTTGDKRITMLRFGETEGSSMKKYSLEAYLRKLEDQNSMNNSIRKSIEHCKNKIHSKESEIEKLEKNAGSKARLESLRRELVDIRNERDSYKAELSNKKTDTGSHSFEQKKKVLEKAHVIFSTLNSCSNHVLTSVFGSRSGRNTKPFMCCIVDEASQTTEPETLAPLLLQVDKLILVGDPHQLGATVLSQEAESRAFGLSLFSRLYEHSTNKPQSVVMLTQQYRMHPEILAWPNEYFYSGMLKTQCIGRSADDECYSLKPYLFLNLSSQETSNGEGQISNEQEAKMVLGIIRNIHLVFNSGTDSTKKKLSIGVITPYSTQKNAIVSDVKKELGSAADVEIDTVDSFQGKEKDIIIISCVRTDDTGFLKNPKRLNVALTRARHSLLIVGDADCLRKDQMWKSLIDNAKDRKCLYNIERSEWNVPGFLRKRLFHLLSPQKSLIPGNDPRRNRL